MKKVLSLFAFTALLFSMNANAQQEPKQKKKKAKTEKSCEKGAEKKDGCCSSKKAADKKA